MGQHGENPSLQPYQICAEIPGAHPRCLKVKVYSSRTSIQPPLCIEIARDESKASDTLDHSAAGELDLRKGQFLGNGGHSYVYLAPLTLSSSAEPIRQVEVAVKLTNSFTFTGKDLLTNEAEIYAKFPCELQESTPSSPPVVPKFFGYYEPSCEFVDSYKCEDGDEEDAGTMRTHIRKVLNNISPILLLEPCGKDVDVEKLSKSAR